MSATDNGLYKLVVLGGGPAGIGIFIRAARTGFLPRLLHPEIYGTETDVACSKTLGMKQKGVAIVHDGDLSTFGSGNLGKYIINSNTFARSLLSSVLDEKPELDPPESIQNTFLAVAKEHESTKRLEATGNAPACLVDFGHFLQNVGSCLMEELTHTKNASTNKCMLNTSAIKLEQQVSGIYRIETRDKLNDQTTIIFAEHIVLAMGGVQSLPPSLESNPMYANKLFLSDECLREDGVTKLREHLRQCEGEKRKVCIVGGSHSSFSVAWLLLNKDKQRKKSPSPSLTTTVPEILTNPIDDGPEVSSTEIPCSPHKGPMCVPPTTTESILSSCEQTSKDQDTICASPLRRLNVQPMQIVPPSAIKTPNLSFQPKDITILHRSAIRCYYATRKEAEADGADGSRVDRTGCVNTFTGLREDAKNLFREIRSQKENRVRLFQVNPHGCQNLTNKAYESASAIVWCCGYKTRMIPAFDANGDELHFKMDDGVIQLDLHARVHVLQSSKTFVPVNSLLGVGLGFSLRSHVDEMGTETRADGVTVYHRRGAALVLAALFGTKVFGESKSFEEMVEKNDLKKKKDRAESTMGIQLVDKVRRGSPSMTVINKTPQELADVPPPMPCNVVPVPETSQSSHVIHDKSMRIKQVQPEHSAAVVETKNPVTNPPVKLLLQRRRSTEALRTRPLLPVTRSIGKSKATALQEARRKELLVKSITIRPQSGELCCDQRVEPPPFVSSSR